MTQPDPIQVQLAAARRAQILDAATKVFAEKGFHNATIKDVAKAAGIADGKIYNYFENKTALLLGILDRLNESAQRESHFQQVADADIQDWLAGYIKQRYAMFPPEVLQVFRSILPEIIVNKDLQELYNRQIIQPTYDIADKFFQKWVAEGKIKAVDPELAMRVISGMAFGLLMLRLIGDPQVEARWDEFPEIVAEIVLNAFLPRQNNHQSSK